jgi:protease IV
MRRLLAVALFSLAFVVSGCAVEPTTASVDPLREIVISGVIDDSTPDQVATRVAAINADTSAKAVLITVNSGGGGVQASAEVYDELSKLTVPAVVWCDDVCASGAMWISMTPSVKLIEGRPGILCGSIGVISHIERMPANDNLETYRSGKLKQANSHPGAPTQDEKDYLQKQVDEMAAVFYSLVDKARGKKISPANWEEIKTARVFFDRRCVEVGLLDGIMSKEAAAAKARSLIAG